MNVRRSVCMAVLLAGSAYLLQGGCAVGSLLNNFNPCGTVLNCNPAEYRFIQAGYQGPGADPSVDPFCTWPPFCPDDVDPIAP